MPVDARDPVEFRQARISDAADLLQLIRAYYRFDRIRFRSNTIDPALRKLLRNPSLGRIWIMCDGANAIGYVVLTFNYDLEFGGLEGIVTDLFILSEYRTRGLGRHALAVGYAYCRSAGIHSVELQVEEDNKAAQKFYLKLGFRKLSRLVMSHDVKCMDAAETLARRLT
jgi:ribosomal protein S18 acetylase RimI-like enzyme